MIVCMYMNIYNGCLVAPDTEWNIITQAESLVAAVTVYLGNILLLYATAW